MVIAGLGQCADRGTGHHLLVDLQIGVGFLKRLDAHVEVVLEGGHHALVLGALDVRSRGDDVQLGSPGVGEVGRDLQCLQAPLGFVGAHGHLGDGVVQMHQVAVIVGVRNHHDRTVRVCRKAGAGRAQQTFGQTTLAAVADDDEIVVAGQFHEHRRRIPGDDQRGRLDALLVRDRLGLRQNLLGVGMRRVVVAHGGVGRIKRNRGVTRQRVRTDDLQRQSRVLRVIRCPPRGLVAGVGTINTNEDCLVVNHGRPP